MTQRFEKKQQCLINVNLVVVLICLALIWVDVPSAIRCTPPQKILFELEYIVIYGSSRSKTTTNPNNECVVVVVYMCFCFS